MVAGTVSAPAPAPVPARIAIDIWSDVMCPWCVIGYHQLLKGLALLDGEIEAELRWHPFELNPDMPAEGEGQLDHVARKYGRSAEQAAEGRARMLQIGADAGYSFAYTGPEPEPPARMWNTFLAHKLLLWVLATQGGAAQTRLKQALFDAHFQQRRNVSDPAVLIAIAAEAGFDAGTAQRALLDPELGEEVRRGEQQAWDLNISGVPAMLVGGKFMIPGAQEPQVYADILRRVVARS